MRTGGRVLLSTSKEAVFIDKTYETQKNINFNTGKKNPVIPEGNAGTKDRTQVLVQC